MSAIYTVLAEGDDQQDPVVDTARAILDGHIVLTRQLAERGHYPAIDISQSVSRCMSSGCSPAASTRARVRCSRWLQSTRRFVICCRWARYVPGADPATDKAVELYPKIEAFLHQGTREAAPLTQTIAALEGLMA